MNSIEFNRCQETFFEAALEYFKNEAEAGKCVPAAWHRFFEVMRRTLGGGCTGIDVAAGCLVVF